MFDRRTGQWGGYETQRTIDGIEDRIKPGIHAHKLRGISPRSKDDMLDEIAQRYNCDLDRAEQIWRTCKTNDVLRYDKPSNTWRSWDVDPPTEGDVFERPVTTKQEEYWQRFSELPNVTHNYLEPWESEHLAWIVWRECELGNPIGLLEADRIRSRVWGCSRDESKIPWRKVNGHIVGKDYIEPMVLRDEIRAKIRALEPNQWSESDFAYDAAKALAVSKNQAAKLLAEAREAWRLEVGRSKRQAS